MLQLCFVVIVRLIRLIVLILLSLAAEVYLEQAFDSPNYVVRQVHQLNIDLGYELPWWDITSAASYGSFYGARSSPCG